MVSLDPNASTMKTCWHYHFDRRVATFKFARRHRFSVSAGVNFQLDGGRTQALFGDDRRHVCRPARKF